jgi:hypothetical protein
MKPIALPQLVLEEARAFFEERGVHGYEGTALIAQTLDGSTTRLIVPPQTAGRGYGCWVEVPVEGKLYLATALSRDERYVARIHSHPGEAFHSSVDDDNPVLTHDGALSIVAPYFGLGLRRGLEAAAVFVRQANVWLELEPGPEREAWLLVENSHGK